MACSEDSLFLPAYRQTAPGSAQAEPTSTGDPAADLEDSRSVPFRLVKTSISRCERLRRTLVTAMFVPSAIEQPRTILGCVRIGGVSPLELHSVRIGSEHRTVFEMKTLADEMGRSISAGELLEAVFGRRIPQGLCISARQFQGPVAIFQTFIELQVSACESSPASGLKVSCGVN